eukprot:c22505_g1_i1 orf=1553-4558(+)
MNPRKVQGGSDSIMLPKENDTNPQKVQGGSDIIMLPKGNDTSESPQPSVPFQAAGIAVAVGKRDSSVQALKWTLETLMPSSSGPLHLLHVQDPLRVVQTSLGPLPYDQANEEFRKKAKQQQFAATEKLLQKYRQLCEKKKVEFKVHCMECTSIQKAVVEQVVKLGISKLVLGSSSNSKLKKFLKGPKTSAVLAQNVPDFCAVMVVRKGRLSSVKDANHLKVSSESSPFPSTKNNVSMHGTKDTLSEPGMYSPMTDRSLSYCPRTDSADTLSEFGSYSSRTDRSLSYCAPSPRTDNSLPYWTPSLRTDNSLPYWTPSPSTECGSTPDIRHREAAEDDGKVIDNARMKASMNQLQFSFKDPIISSTSDQCESLNGLQPSCGASGSQAMERRTLEEKPLKPGVMDARCDFSRVAHEARTNTTSKLATHIEEPTCADAQVHIGPCQPLHMTSGLGRTPHIPVQSIPAVHEPKQRHKTPSGSVHFEEVPKAQDDLRKLEACKSQMVEEIRKRDDLCVALRNALKLSEENALQAVTEEVKMREEVVAALSNAKIEADSFKQELNMAKQQAAVDRSRYIEALAKVEELKKELAKETESRTNAEERAWKAKQDVARLLRKAQREYIEYSFEELRLATDDFCEEGKLGEGGYGGVYKGTLNDMVVAVKVLQQAGVDGQQQFQHEVEVLSAIRHPHIVVLLGACQERACIVYEYMENGSLEDRLMCKNGTPPLPWYVRFSICFEVATALIFLHNLSPNPIVHRDLKPGNILLDCNFVSKLSDAGLARWIPSNVTYNYTVYRETNPAGTFAYMDPEYLRTGSFGPHSDTFALGIVILQVLTGKKPVGVVDLVEAAIDEHRLHEVLDQSAGEWPLAEAEYLAKLGLLCAEPRRRDRPSLEVDVFGILKKLHEIAEGAVAITPTSRAFYGLHNGGIPNAFVCPLTQEVMRDPHTAADGFTYEFVAIKNWLVQQDISPMTNLKLAHKQLSKNHSLQAKIQSWKQETKHGGSAAAG